MMYGGTERRIVFIQFSDKLYPTGHALRKFYENTYANMSGYTLSEHWFEPPTWVAVLTGMLEEYPHKNLLVVTPNNFDGIVRYLDLHPRAIVLLSVLDITRVDALKLARAIDNVMLVGGYVDLDAFVDEVGREKHNIHAVPTIDRIAEYLPAVIPSEKAEIDYSLLGGDPCIPRLTMSRGCSHACQFCTIPQRVKALPKDEIKKQVESFRPLRFKLVYLDDKTFGQADNWVDLRTWGDEIRAYNPDFQGFIVQTTAVLAAKYADVWATMGIKYVEIGVECYDNQTLKELHKPHRTQHIDAACVAIRKAGLKLIPNVLLCIPRAKYEQTICLIQDNLDIIPTVNFFNLSAYYGAKGERSGWLTWEKSEDSDEMSFDKSWLTPYEIRYNVKIQATIRNLFVA